MPLSMIDPNVSLGALVADRPARAPVFERLRLDYCCGGGQTLADACVRRGLDVETVRQMLELLDGTELDQPQLENHDWRRASIAELCEHIVSVHHDGLRLELPRIGELLATVVRVHGAGHGELHDLQRLFGAMREELESHIETEERVVFPLGRAAEADGSAVDEGLLVLHEQEHASVGDMLAAMRDLACDYDTPHALCRKHRTLLESLRALEFDLHQHIHEENNVLFPRVRALNLAPPDAKAGRPTSPDR